MNSKRNIFLIVFLIVFIIVGAGVTYSASTYLYNSNIIGYDNSNSNLTSTDVQGALDELYNTYVNNTGCPDGYEYGSLGQYGYKCTIPLGISNILGDAVMDNIASTYVSASTGINFGGIASNTNGKGLYIRSGTENNTFPIYYYRGDVSNNYVIFANFCWQIVRTTETGGVKLIYKGYPSSGKCSTSAGEGSITTSKYNNAYNAAQYVGYTYGTNNATNSVLKTTIDNWYASNMTAYTSYLEDTVWCNDRTIYSSANNGTLIDYMGYQRIGYASYKGYTPDLDCNQAADKYTVSADNGNGKLTYPVATLTSDEVWLAGALDTNSPNTAFYLKTSYAWWTMTPATNYSSQAIVFLFDYTGKFSIQVNNARTDYVRYVRPAVSLKPGTTFSSGDGTADNPYVVATE